MFYAWECLSLVLKNRSTIDFVIKDNKDLMCLLHVLVHGLNKIKRECIPGRVTNRP